MFGKPKRKKKELRRRSKELALLEREVLLALTVILALTSVIAPPHQTLVRRSSPPTIPLRRVPTGAPAPSTPSGPQVSCTKSPVAPMSSTHPICGYLTLVV